MISNKLIETGTNYIETLLIYYCHGKLHQTTLLLLIFHVS